MGGQKNLERLNNLIKRKERQGRKGFAKDHSNFNLFQGIFRQLTSLRISISSFLRG